MSVAPPLYGEINMFSYAVREAAGAVLDREAPCKVALGVEEELFPASCALESTV